MEQKKMTAKQFLNQIRKIDSLIENKMIERAQWKDIAHGTTAFSTGERVQSSGSKDKMADAVTQYTDIESEIDAFILDKYQKKKEIIAVIEQLDTAEYDVLHKVYVQNISLNEVADICGKTYSWVTMIHGNALKNVQKMIDGKGTTWEE